MYHFIYTITFWLVIIIFPSQGYSLPIAKVTVKAIDEKGKPISGAKVHMSFSIPKKGEWGLDDIFKQGITDKEGKFTESNECYPNMGFSVDKEGYYQSGDRIEFNKYQGLLDKKWEPWNPTIEVVLKKKRNPVPMYRYGGIVKIPKFQEPVGYDLEKGDWVSPFGKGIKSDFIFTFHTTMRAYRDYECSFELQFSNVTDGIQVFYFDKEEQSRFRWPFLAPEGGYVNLLSRYEIKKPMKNHQTDAKKNINYIFRIRSHTDNNGNIVEAKYGKIEGEFGFDPTGNISFYYYYNPDGSRNLEENPDINLFELNSMK